jgi:hypothetical protein
MIGQLLPNTNEMLQCILAIQILDLNTASLDKLQQHLVDLTSQAQAQAQAQSQPL